MAAPLVSIIRWWVLVGIILLACVADGGREENKSAHWMPTAADQFDGGFSSLDGMLQWAIGHSDPVKLKEKAGDVQRLSSDELRTRQLELKDLMEKLKMPSDAELMQKAIADLNNFSLSLDDKQRALNELLILVEPIDNANDLDKLGGLIAVVRELSSSEPEIRTTSAWILGKASQNNALVQKQILELGALEKLMKMVNSAYTEEAIKAFYAVSALIRNNDYGQQLFYLENGGSLLQGLISNAAVDIRLQKKAVLLVADLAEYQLENVGHVKHHFFGSRLLLKSIVDVALSSDLDLQEKALSAMRSLLQLTYIDASVFKDFCRLEMALERIKEQLEKFMEKEEHRDYAREVESLRLDVCAIFHRKLEKVTWVPT